MKKDRLYLSPPHMGELEEKYIREAFESNWIAPLGPQVDAFEREFAARVGSKHALALSAGTAAVHLALILAGVGKDDEVIASSLTFAASAFPITYLGARPVFIDSERVSWNMDSSMLAEVLKEKAAKGRLPKAVVLVHLYGQSADVDPVLKLCGEYGIPLIEDAAEALGATYKGKSPGTFGKAGVFSFNGNKIITTSGGGMLVSDDEEFIAHARKLATQAREPEPHYEHREIGYNYRMSNIVAAIGRGQLGVLKDRVRRRREIFAEYTERLKDLPGIEFMPEAPWGESNRWLTIIMVDPTSFGIGREEIRLALEAENIEARPVWKPMHMQPVFQGCEYRGNGVSEGLFEKGLCLPSGTAMTGTDIERVVSVIRSLYNRR